MRLPRSSHVRIPARENKLSAVSYQPLAGGAGRAPAARPSTSNPAATWISMTSASSCSPSRGRSLGWGQTSSSGVAAPQLTERLSDAHCTDNDISIPGNSAGLAEWAGGWCDQAVGRRSSLFSGHCYGQRARLQAGETWVAKSGGLILTSRSCQNGEQPKLRKPGPAFFRLETVDRTYRMIGSPGLRFGVLATMANRGRKRKPADGARELDPVSFAR